MARGRNSERDVAAAHGKVAENTLTARLVSLLKEKGIHVDFERTFTTHLGERKPDFVIDLPNDQICVGSAKLGTDKELEALSSAQEYQQSLGRTYPLKETLAVVYPRKTGESYVLRVLATSTHEAASWKFSELGLMASKIQNLVEYNWTLVHKGHEPEEVSMIRLLRRGVEELESALRNVPLESIELIFGGRLFFQTVLGLESEEKIPVGHLKTAAAYLLVNQIMFYERLSRETERFPQIDDQSLDDAGKIQSEYFDKVLEVDYQPIYGFEIVTKISGAEATSALKKVVLALRALAPHRLERDVLGKVFHELIPLDLRKTVAAYFTNASAANLLAALTIESSDSSVLDAACGSGSLLVAAYQQKAALAGGGKGTRTSSLAATNHRQFVETDLTGVDIMPFSAHLAAVQLALQAPLCETNNVRILVHDSTGLTPGASVSSVKEVFHDAFTQKVLDSYSEGSPSSVVALSKSPKKPVQLRKVDVVLMNPPFTRHERLPPLYKDQLKNRFSGYEECLAGQIPLHGYFVFLADKFLKDGGRIGFVLPATTLNLNSLCGVRRYLAGNYQVHALVATFKRAAFSEDTEFREVLLVASKNPPKAGDRTGIFFLKSLPASQKEATNLASMMMRAKGKDNLRFRDRLFDAYFVDAQRFGKEHENWFKFVAVSDLDLLVFWDTLTVDNELLLPFGAFHDKQHSSFLSSLRIERKTLVSTPSTFVVRHKPRSSLEEDRWFVSAATEKCILAKSVTGDAEVSIPQSCLLPSLRRGSNRRMMDISEDHDFVVVKDFDQGRNFFGTDQSEYCSDLGKWREKATNRLSNLALFRRFDLSAQGTSHIAFYSDVPFAATDILLTVKDVPTDYAKVLTLWLNSTPNLLQILLERIETRGSFIETPVFVCQRLLVPDTTALSQKSADALVAVFDEVRRIQFPSMLDQLDKHFPPRIKMDMALLRVLGYPNDRLRESVLTLHKQVLDEILKLKTLMNPQD